MPPSHTDTKHLRRDRSTLILRFVVGLVCAGLVVAIVLLIYKSGEESIETVEVSAPILQTNSSIEELCLPERFMAAYLEAQGGIATLRGLDTIAITADLEIGEKVGTLWIYRKQPNLLRVAQDFGRLEVIKAFDGEEVWLRTSRPGEPDEVEILTGEDELSFLKQTSFFDWIITAYFGEGRIVEPIEVVDYESRQTLKVIVENAYEDRAEIIVDPDTMYPIVMRTKTERGQTVENLNSEYIEVEGIWMPSVIVTKINGQHYSRTKITSAKVNIGLLTDYFQK